LDATSAADVLPVSVVIATVGPANRIAACLASISQCNPLPAEIIVVDQSDDAAVHAAVEGLAYAGAKLLISPVRGKSPAVNLGMREAAHEIVLLTDDDCTVDPNWVGAAWIHVKRSPEAIVTGQVLPVGDAAGVASLVGLEEPRDYTGQIHDDVLFGCNMVGPRSLVLALGGFDHRVQLVEDNDLCYRWLRAGQQLHYDPSLVVWHHAWRTPHELERQFRGYARSQGIFYAKHLRRRDFGVVRFLVRDARRAARGIASRIVHGRREWPDARRALPRGVVVGLITGWKGFAPRGAESPSANNFGLRHGGGN
jgi:GT2 family glycosyltransferase